MDSVALPTSPATLSAPAASMAPAQMLAQLRRYWVIIGACAAIGASASYLYARSLPKVYTAAAALEVECSRIAIQ